MEALLFLRDLLESDVSISLNKTVLSTRLQTYWSFSIHSDTLLEASRLEDFCEISRIEARVN